MKTLHEPSQNVFVLHHQIANVLAEHFGLRDTRDLPSYCMPTDEARMVAERVLDLSIDPNTGVEIVFYDENVCLSGVACIIGPSHIAESVGDKEGPASFLWNRGPTNLYFDQIS